MAKHSRVSTSSTVKHRKRRPSANWSATKSNPPHLVRCRGPETLAPLHRCPPLPSGLVPQSQTFFPVQAIHQLLPHFPTFAVQQHPNLPVAVANSSLCDLPNPQPQRRPWFLPTFIAEGRDRKPRHTTGTPLAHPVGVVPVAHHRAAPRGRHSFFASTSWSITLSNVSSATNRFNRPFSSWSCLNCRTWSVSSPLYCFF